MNLGRQHEENTPQRDNGSSNHDGDINGDGEISVGESIRMHRRLWRATPRPLRRMIVAVLGGTLILLGALLVVLPGPFTLPLILLGLVVLASEYHWAERLLEKSRQRAAQAGRRLRRKR